MFRSSKVEGGFFSIEFNYKELNEIMVQDVARSRLELQTYRSSLHKCWISESNVFEGAIVRPFSNCGINANLIKRRAWNRHKCLERGATGKLRLVVLGREPQRTDASEKFDATRR